MTSQTSPLHKPIRSFIRRQGRLTPGQQYALDQLWPRYGLAPKCAFAQDAIFGRTAPLILEIGFGNGESLLAMAQANPQQDYLGVEVHQPGVGHLMLKLAEQQLENVRVYSHDAIEILQECLPDHSLNGVQLFFPDPWHKTRHHKRRIVNSGFLDLLARKLVKGGYFHAATDWQHYAEQMLAVLSAHSAFENTRAEGGYAPRPDYRPLTKFENRGIGLGHGVWDLIFIKQ